MASFLDSLKGSALSRDNEEELKKRFREYVNSVIIPKMVEEEIDLLKKEIQAKAQKGEYTLVDGKKVIEGVSSLRVNNVPISYNDSTYNQDLLEELEGRGFNKEYGIADKECCAIGGILTRAGVKSVWSFRLKEVLKCERCVKRLVNSVRRKVKKGGLFKKEEVWEPFESEEFTDVYSLTTTGKTFFKTMIEKAQKNLINIELVLIKNDYMVGKETKKKISLDGEVVIAHRGEAVWYFHLGLAYRVEF